MVDDTVSAAHSRRWRTWMTVVIAVIVLAAVVAVAVHLSGGDDEAGVASTDGAVSSEPARELPSIDPTDNPAGHIGEPEDTDPTEASVDVPVAGAVALDQPAALGESATVTVVGIEAVDGEAQGAGQTSGPALRVTVRVTNESSDAIALGGAVLNLYYGADNTPADVLGGPGAAAFPASVAPGDSADTVAVFSVPTDQRSSITIELSSAEPLGAVLFTGSGPA